MRALYNWRLRKRLQRSDNILSGCLLQRLMCMHHIMVIYGTEFFECSGIHLPIKFSKKKIQFRR
jgi:hypothetical protein